MSTLFFLGSGASAPFGIPTMKGLVNTFEKQLYGASEPDSEEMYDLYERIKTSLESIYSYVDLESIFTVVEDLSKNAKYSNLGFTSAYILSSSLEITKNRNLANGKEKRLANGLKLRIKELARHSCELDYKQDTHIKELFENLYQTIADKAGRHYVRKVNDKEIWHENWPIYTTNYDEVQEIYWEGIAEINTLVEKDRAIEKIDVGLISNPGLKLVKLHGSLDWWMLDDGTIVKSKSSRIRVGGQTVTGEMMLYPLNQKDLYLYPWLELFRAFKNDLIKTPNWVAIGYSFNDLFIREIFLESLKRTDHRLIVACPRASKIVEEKFGDIENIYPVDGRLEDRKTIAEIGDLIQPETEGTNAL